ncbi:MAG: GNAT family N-acetyltransferase [Oscillospiraceae bacterium]|nr:GNAT family N-acetyltransferase [Oscillospiraceae bacterium]
MVIRPYTHYKECDILPLYKAVGWSNYYEHPHMLKKAYAGSLCILAAYKGEELAGVIRAVGDGHSILFIQDILVYPKFQRKGIGSALMKAMLERYAHVYQIELATDNTAKTIAFYKSLGFHPLHEIGCCGFLKSARF